MFKKVSNKNNRPKDFKIRDAFTGNNWLDWWLEPRYGLGVKEFNPLAPTTWFDDKRLFQKNEKSCSQRLLHKHNNEGTPNWPRERYDNHQSWSQIVHTQTQCQSDDKDLSQLQKWRAEKNYE